jgi:hypothetical protein
MKYATKMGSGVTIYIQSFIKTGSDIQKLIGRDLQIQRQHRDCCQPRLGKLQATSPLLVVRVWSPAQGVLREMEYIYHPNMLQLLVGGSRKTPSCKLSGLQTRGGDAEVMEGTQDYNRKGILFQPHHYRHVLHGGAPRQDRGAAAASDTSGGSGGSLRPYQSTNSRQQVSQFRLLM